MVADQAIFMTQEGFEKLQEEYRYLTQEKRQLIAERIRAAKELGDLSENAEYADAKEEQAFVEGRILELEYSIKNAKVVKHSKGSSTVEVGSTVQVEQDGKQMTFTIVGSNETNPTAGMISNRAPFGKALIGKKAGETVEISVPKGMVQIKILDVK